MAAVALAALLLVGCWLAVRGNPQTGVDRVAFDLLALESTGPIADAAPAAVDVAGIIIALAGVAAAIFLLAHGAWRDCLAIGAGLLVCQLTAHIGKAAIERPRPSHELVSAGGFSFPSTTSALAVGIAFTGFALARVAPARHRHAIAATGIALTFLLGISFIVLRVHYLTDVLAGWALGVIAFTLCAAIVGLLLGTAARAPEHL